MVGQALQPVAGLGQLLLDQPALGDVGHHAVDQPGAVVGHSRGAALPQPPHPAVEADHPVLELRVLARAHPLPGVVVGGAIVGVHAVLPGRLGIHSRGNAAEQAFHRLTDPHATAIRAVGQGLELVDVHAGGAADAAEQAGEGDGLLPVTVPRCEGRGGWSHLRSGIGIQAHAEHPQSSGWERPASAR